MCSPPPPLLPRTDNLKFWLVGHHDLNPPHHHDNRSSQPPTSVWNLKCFFWMSVSAPSKYPSPAQAVKEEQISYYISFFFGLSPTQSIYELKEAKPNVVKDAFSLFGHFKCFFFFHMQYFVRGMFWSFNTLPLFQHHTRCLKRVPRKPD